MTSRAAATAGARNNLVSLMQPDTTPDAYGQPPGTYLWVADVWADVRPTNAREYTASRQTEAAIDAVIKIPYRTDIKATWVVVYETRIYDIQSFSEIGYREGIQILARAREQ